MATDILQLQSEAQSLIDRILKTDIAKWAKQILANHIESDIYARYTPKTNGWVIGRKGNYNAPFQGRQRATYQRRHNLPRLVYSKLTSSGVLFVSSSAKRRPSIYPSEKKYAAYAGDFLKLIEGDSSKPNGGLGVWHGGFPRPAVSNAQREVDEKLPQELRAIWKTYTGC